MVGLAKEAIDGQKFILGKREEIRAVRSVLRSLSMDLRLRINHELGSQNLRRLDLMVADVEHCQDVLEKSMGR
jgi:hypothetical protein